jgi:(R,R)-butanediol dehydrogenase/meso-butanediol dehydrogenase/diacetyl reductase
MKALRWHGVKDVRLEHIAEPTVSQGKVKIKVEWCGICGSDLHEYTAGPIFIPTEEPHPLSKDKTPVVLGHEFSGQVVEIGEGITNVKVGDRVVVEPIYHAESVKTVNKESIIFVIKWGFMVLPEVGEVFLSMPPYR